MQCSIYEHAHNRGESGEKMKVAHRHAEKISVLTKGHTGCGEMLQSERSAVQFRVDEHEKTRQGERYRHRLCRSWE
jgi:hypothetical protein